MKIKVKLYIVVYEKDDHDILCYDTRDINNLGQSVAVFHNKKEAKEVLRWFKGEFPKTKYKIIKHKI